MFKIYDNQSRVDYWESYWSAVGEVPNQLDRYDIYPLYPADQYILDGKKILEVGCGLGRVVKHYQNKNFDMVGFDYEGKSVSNLKNANPELKLFVGDANHIPHKPDTFDIALAFGTLSNIEDPRGAIREIWKVLKPSGQLIASVTNDSFIRRFIEWSKNLRNAEKHFSMIAYTVSEWEQILEENGFTVIEVTPVVTRLPLHKFFPFLRKGNQDKVFHDSDQNTQLNFLGEWIFRKSFKVIPFIISHGLVAVATKAGSR